MAPHTRLSSATLPAAAVPAPAVTAFAWPARAELLTSAEGTIVARDHRLVVVDKPAGVTSEEVARARSLRLVHRIDRATSGLLLLADDARTVQRMQRLLSQAAVTRTYLGLAHGHVPEGIIDFALSDQDASGRRQRRRCVPAGTVGAKPARTVVEVVARGPRASLVRATLVTGRTHQIRLHLSGTGHPLWGDRVYGSGVDGVAAAAPRLLLHAVRLGFCHPNSHAAVAFFAPPPQDFLDFVAAACGPDVNVLALDAAAAAGLTRPSFPSHDEQT
jgi:RluA family pseudouridine synthase